ncbi:MAG: hypothetical protein HRU15_04660 [Planctomycetes bacterium]|nr:hypothetical protein [Planctomycetota bacterium]
MNDKDTLSPSQIFWPVNGIWYFSIRPMLWFAPMFACSLAWIVSIFLACLVMYWNWPTAEVVGFWAQLIATAWALAYGVLCFVAFWIIAIPFVMGMAYERLALKVLRQQGYDLEIAQEEGESTIGAMVSSGRIFVRGLPWRITWGVLGFLSMFIFPPISIFIGAVGLGHICILDVSEIVLVALAQDGEQRKEFYQRNRKHLLAVGCVAGLCSLLLACTLFGLLLWLPGIICAAALAIPLMLDFEDPEIA